MRGSCRASRHEAGAFQSKDQCGRIVGRVFVGTTNVDAKIVCRANNAWRRLGGDKERAAAAPKAGGQRWREDWIRGVNCPGGSAPVALELKPLVEHVGRTWPEPRLGDHRPDWADPPFQSWPELLMDCGPVR
jgi:hypothetical protein